MYPDDLPERRSSTQRKQQEELPPEEPTKRRTRRRGNKSKPPDLNALSRRPTRRSYARTVASSRIIGEQAQREAQRLAEQRAEELVREREERWRAEQSRQEVLAKARNGDYYAIGEQAAREALQRDQEGGGQPVHASAPRRRPTRRCRPPSKSGRPQQPPEVNEAAAERMGELDPGTPWETGFRKWLDAYVQVRAEHLTTQPETKQRAERDVTPAVRARVLAEMNGKEPTADSGSGRPQRVRTVTDDDIARMSLDEYMDRLGCGKRAAQEGRRLQADPGNRPAVDADA